MIELFIFLYLIKFFLIAALAQTLRMMRFVSVRTACSFTLIAFSHVTIDAHELGFVLLLMMVAYFHQINTRQYALDQILIKSQNI